MEGVTTVATRPSDTLASPAIQEAVTLRIHEYPQRAKRDQHVAHAFVPVGVAALLREYPTLLAPAVAAFCDRDSLDSKALRTMRHFPPEQRVMTAVRFSKALYAKLQARPYCPDTKTGWSLPQPTNKSYPQHLLGVKVACGFELLVCNAGGVTPMATTPASSDADGNDETSAIADSVTSNPRWLKYKKSLIEKGYFRGELEGSKLYKELESNALVYFSQHMLKSNRGREESMDTLSAGSLVVKLLPTVNADLDYFKEREKRLVPADDDSWLTVSPELLDDMLENHVNGNRKTCPSNDDQLQAKLETLLAAPSDPEGIEIGEDLQEKLRKLSTLSLPRRKVSHAQRKISQSASRKVSTASQHRKISSQSCASNASEMSSFSNKIDFNADSFMDAVKSILDVDVVPEDDYWNDSDDESSGLSSYGDDTDNDPASENPSRKVSNGSQDSAVSGSEDVSTLRSAMRAMEQELRATTLSETLRSKSDQRQQDSEDIGEDHDGEFDDVEDFSPVPVKVDKAAVEQLVKAYKQEKKSLPGPATTLINTLGMIPNSDQE